ncbi:AAA family ATPase [Nocardia sp. NPDC046473]|uniref:helix-turn-helix transcriptional regulator n=1 Tax=Nocardia sp. NPDC046473 TaxID=3155733 RepID=UPI0033EB2FF1
MRRSAYDLGNFFDEAVLSPGKLSAILVTGPVASGKSTIVDYVAACAVESGAVVLRGFGAEAERNSAYGVLGQLVRGSAVWDELTNTASQLLADGIRSGGLGIQAMTELASMLVRCTGSRPLLIAIDDLQDVDTGSLEWLSVLLREAGNAPVVVLAAGSSEAQARHPRFCAELLRQVKTVRVKVGPFSRAEVVELVAGETSAQLASVIGERSYEISGGNPLLVKALLADHRMSDTGAGAVGSVEPGDYFAIAVTTCLSRMAPLAQHAMRAMAVLGRRASIDMVAGLLGATPADVRHALVSLCETGLVRDYEYCHPAIAAAVLADISGDERRKWHAAAARTLYEAGAAVTEVAAQFIAADAVEFSWGVSVLRSAAHQADAGDRVSFGVQALELARRDCGDRTLMAQLTADLTGLLWRVDPAAAARHLDELLELFRDGHLPLAEAAVLVRYLLWHGRAEDAAEVLPVIIARSHDADNHSVTELAITSFSIQCSYPLILNRLSDDLRDDFQRLWISVLKTSDYPVALALDRIMATGADDEALARAEHVLQSHQQNDRLLESVRSALFALIYLGKLEKAEHWCERLLHQVRKRAAPSWEAILAAARAEIAIRRDDMLEAEHYAEAALSLMSPQGWGVVIGVPLATLCLVTVAMGKTDRAAELMRQPVPKFMLQTRFGVHYLYARGCYFLEIDQPHTALGDFLACGELAKKGNWDRPSVVAWRIGAVDAYLRIGQQGRARELLDEQLAMAGDDNPVVRGRGLRLQAATTELSRRRQLLGEAINLLQANGARVELAVALHDLSRTYYALGEPSRARELDRRAWHIAQASHGAGISRHFARESADSESNGTATVETLSGIGGLSEAERKVAMLAGLGYPNREIASKLCVTISTVEQHLTRVYRKLHVRGRRDLPMYLRSASIVPPA